MTFSSKLTTGEPSRAAFFSRTACSKDTGVAPQSVASAAGNIDLPALFGPWRYRAMTATSMMSPPASEKSRNFIAAYCRRGPPKGSV